MEYVRFAAVELAVLSSITFERPSLRLRMHTSIQKVAR